VAGNAGDNPLVQRLLVQAYQLPLSEDFQSRLDEPLYQPTDRLLLQRAGKLIGHVQVSKLTGWFQGQRCPLARLQDFVTLPEYRCSDLDSPLLTMAESVAVNEGAVLGFVRSDRPEWFEQHGWSCCRGQGHTRANTREILSHLNSHQSKQRRDCPTIEVCTWRHFQLDSILKVYQQLSTNMWGTLQRSLESWQWLVGRKAHDQILLAIDNSTAASSAPSATDLANQPNVVGYAIVRDSCIVELLTLPEYSAARSMLLVQACRDAIDRDHHFVSLHTPTADPLHELLVTAGGSWITDSADAGGQWMLKLLAPDRWIERLYPVLHERAREADIRRPLEIDFAIEQGFQRFTLTRRSSRLEPIAHSSVAVQCDWRALQDLLTSNLTFPEAITQGRLRSPHLSILRMLAALFPPKLFWQSPFPLLRL
jgi:predicted acetyltransferase